MALGRARAAHDSMPARASSPGKHSQMTCISLSLCHICGISQTEGASSPQVFELFTGGCDQVQEAVLGHSTLLGQVYEQA